MIRLVMPCRWTLCPNKTRRVMLPDSGDRTTIVLCEFHLRKIMNYLREASNEYSLFNG